MRMLSIPSHAVLAIGLWSSLTGCVTVQPGDAYWGRDARLAPGWARVKHAAADAVRSPFTWAPVLGALAIQAYDMDDEVTDETRQDAPIFGSTHRADQASDVLRGVSWVFYGTTGSVAPYPDSGSAWSAKLKGFGVGLAAMGTTQGVTFGMKEITERQRPNKRDDRSFPSGHASNTAVVSRLTQRNLEYFRLAPSSRGALNAGLGLITAMTAWARVEAGEHHLSDVLVGSALGNFFGILFNDTFLGRASTGGVTVGREGAGAAGMRMRFEMSRDHVVTLVSWDM